MARINIEDKWWNDPRRTRLIKLLNGNSTLADGSFLQALRASQDHCETGFIPWAEAQYLDNIELLVECDLVTIFEANVKQTPSKAKQTIANAKENVATVEQMQAYVAGTQNSNGWLKKRREAAKKGGVKSASKRKKASKSDLKAQANGKQTEANVKQTEPSYSYSYSSSYSNSESCSENLLNFDKNKISESKKENSLNQLVFDTYSQEYITKTGISPIRNAKLNSQISHLVKRLPKEDLVSVIKFYFKHSDPFYAKTLWSFDPLLKNAEKLRTEMKSGIRIVQPYFMTETQKRQYNNDKAAEEFLKDETIL